VLRPAAAPADTDIIVIVIVVLGAACGARDVAGDAMTLSEDGSEFSRIVAYFLSLGNDQLFG
jgi:hypothetical protein